MIVRRKQSSNPEMTKLQERALEVYKQLCDINNYLTNNIDNGFTDYHTCIKESLINQEYRALSTYYECLKEHIRFIAGTESEYKEDTEDINIKLTNTNKQ